MILRKPYALFIKFFKVIHIIMAVFIGLLIYRTGVLLSFFNSYINDYQTAMEAFSVSGYINLYSFLLVLIIIIANVVVISVMFIKKKPKLLYIYNILIYFGVIVFFGVCYSTLFNMNNTILDIRVSKAIRDVSVIFLVLEAVSFIIVLVRGTGFNFKKFDFDTDLEQLKIEEKDNEEVEVAFEIDKNKINRNFRKNIRNFKYFYVEHSFIINLISVISVIIISFLIYFNTSIYYANYKENEYFSASGFSMKIIDSYWTSKDYNGNTVTDNKLLVVRLEVKKNSVTTEKLNTGLITVKNGLNSYGQTASYNKYLVDFGEGYVDQKLTNDYTPYILVFEIPKDEMNGNLKLKINDNISYIKGEMGAKNIFVKLNVNDISNATKSKEVRLGQTLEFTDSILKDTSVNITKAEINNKFKVNYNFCASKNYCYESSEYIVPTATGNYEKTLLRLSGLIKKSNTLEIKSTNNLLDFINMFGYLNYDVNGEEKSVKINSQTLKSQKVNENNVYYIEVPRECLNSSKLTLVFKIRNITYNYTIK